ncbi:MAG: GH25 family lysozyme [Lawsonibacter sp.]|nr:GH25 family lysozyme [Lawsonibacter sp.]
MYQPLKRIRTRMLPLALSAILLSQPVLAASQPAAPQGWSSPFSDVQDGAWFYPFVAVLNSQGVINGYPDGRFGPNDTTRAGDSMIMILKAAGSGTLESDPGAHYAAVYADYAVNRGWLTQEQVPDDLNGSISRQFVAQLAAKALGLTAIEGASPFADVDDGLVTALYQKGIVAGTKVGDSLLFHPDASITRAEISAIVWQIREYATHIHFGTYTLDILDNVPVNADDPSAFILDGDRMDYAGKGVKTSLGIDVSYHQGVIDWKKVADDDIQFAMIRAGGRYYGSGVVFEDTQFRTNIQGALDAGLDVGVYFFSQAITVEEARDEANFLLNLLKDYDFTGPVVFDWENITNAAARTDGLDRATVTAMANAFCQTVEQAGYSPMIYFNQYIGYLLYNLEDVVQYPFWLAQYGTTPGFYYNFQMWQYTDAAQVDGVPGKVDLNLRILPQ